MWLNTLAPMIYEQEELFYRTDYMKVYKKKAKFHKEIADKNSEFSEKI
jgi:hypothetical protein